MELAPIVLFGYNRPEHITKTIESLKNNNLSDKSDLFVFVDGPKNAEDKVNQKKVCDIVNNITGFKTIQINISDKNKGLANSVIDGVTEIINRFGKAIVLEDDLELSVNFLKFMNEALEFYLNNKKIYSIAGYSTPIKIPDTYNECIYLCRRVESWGWATWKDRWEDIDWDIKDYNKFKNNFRERDNFSQCGDDMPIMLDDQMNGKIDSWAVRWDYNRYKKDAYTVVPVKSLVKNIGCDSTGRHCITTKKYETNVDNEYIWKFMHEIYEDEEIRNRLRIFYNIERNKNVKRILVQNLWIQSLINREKLSDKIIEKFNKNEISIYGFGILGKMLYEQLKIESKIKIKYIVDVNAKYIENISCISPEQFIMLADDYELIIITPVDSFEEIQETLKNYKKINIQSLEKIFK